MMIQLHCGDFRNLIQRVEPNSVDLILTDPPYGRAGYPLWKDLAAGARRVLKPGRFLVTYSGHYGLPKILDDLSSSLKYYWASMVLHQEPILREELNVRTCGKFLLLFYKPPRVKLPLPMRDVFQGTGRDKQWHPWGQPVEEARWFVEALTRPGELVLDPFAGGGTNLVAARDLNRRAIGYELDQRAYSSAVRRLGSK